MKAKDQQKNDLSETNTEVTLFYQAQAGCRSSLNELMSRHAGLVQAVVRRQILGYLPYAEALQAGREGLWQAIQGYDPERGTAFSTYAWTAIMRRVWAAVKAATPVAAGESWPEDELIDEREPGREMEKQALVAALGRAVARLPERQQQVLRARYEEGATYRVIGQGLARTSVRARQLHQEALVRLRQPGLSYELRSLLDKHNLAEYGTTAAQTQGWLGRRAGR
jgi:RNA polymerase sigma factor (sigma-70 family)